MLANGAKLGYKENESASSYTDLPGLKEIPELGADPENVDNTTLADTIKQYEPGIGEAGDMAYKFKWENTISSAYRKIRELAESKKTVPFEQTMADGTKFQFLAIPSIKIGGGGVNAAIEFTLNMSLQSEITVVDPIEAEA